jgi:hypothetical protein
MIGNRIRLTLLRGQACNVEEMNDYTDILGIGGARVPEPSSLVQACIAGGGIMLAIASRRRRRDR